MERRNFIALAGASVVACKLAAAAGDPDLPRVTDPGEKRGDMLYRKLGTTGETVSVIGIDGAHLSREAAAVKLIHAALDRGINFLDNSWATATATARSGWAPRSRRPAIATRRS